MRAKAPVIAAIDEPGDVVSFLNATMGMTLHDATREYMKSAATISSIASSPSNVRVSSLAYGTPLRAFLVTLLNSCQLDVGPALFEGIVDAVVGAHPNRRSVYVSDLIYRDVPGAEQSKICSASDTPSKSLIGDTGRQYETMLTGGDFSVVTCPLALYVSAKGANYETAHPWLPMVGPARCILWGPYIHLPRGKWLAHVIIAVRGNISGNVLQIQILRGLSEYMTTLAKLEENGAFECELEFEIDDPLDRLEITFTLKEGAIEGDFRVVSLTFSKMAKAPW